MQRSVTSDDVPLAGRVCVVQLRYMSFDAKSGERKSLVPVIATLLSFTDEEVGPLLLHVVLHLVFWF